MRKILEQRLENTRNDYEQAWSGTNIHDILLGQIEAYQDCLNLLDQYNIITAPKEIKLSEVIDKLQQYHLDEELYFNEKLNAIGSGEYDDTWYANTWVPCIYFQDNKIHRLVTQPCEATKWFYILWITGATIINDLEELKLCQS